MAMIGMTLQILIEPTKMYTEGADIFLKTHGWFTGVVPLLTDEQHDIID